MKHLIQGSRPFGGAVETDRLHGCLVIPGTGDDVVSPGFCLKFGNAELRNPKNSLASCSW